MSPDLFQRSETIDPDAALRRRIAELEAALATLREAAQPLAAYVEACDRMGRPDDSPVLHVCTDVAITCRHFRALKAALPVRPRGMPA